MKIAKDSQRYQEIKAGIQKIIDHYTLKSLLTYYHSYGVRSMMWKLFNLVWYDLMYDDTHPAYVGGRKRINAHIPGWKMYPEGIHDDHYNTALICMGKELGLVTTSRGMDVIASPKSE